jgi:xylose isomerase
MSTGFFGDIQKIKYEGPDSTNPLAFRHYNPDEIVMGKRHGRPSALCRRLLAHLRLAGRRPVRRPDVRAARGFEDTMEAAKLKADVAFELFSLLGAPYYCFHDADVRPEGKNFAENTRNLNEIVDYFEEKQAETGVKLLWGTANLFSNRRFMSGAATNPDPDVFAFCGGDGKTCLDVTKRLGGENYVLWGGREGYETLLNTDLPASSTSSAASSTSSSSTSTRSASRADPDRAEAAGADQAPVRLRRRDRLRLPQEATGWRTR